MSVFTMDQVNAVVTKDLPSAKEYALGIIHSADNIRTATKANAIRVINNARNVITLASAMSNWILAHPSENLKVI